MNKTLVKAISVTIAFMLVFAMVVPVYADARTKTSESNNVKRHTSSINVNANQAENVEVQPYGIKTQLVKAALKHGGSAAGKLIKKIPFKWAKKVGASIEKWGYKAAGVVGELTSFSESYVTLALAKAGIPPNDAALLAKFIVFFLG
ncbi:hypothetical protein ACW0KB_15540 [Virgibacillus salarius]